MSYHPSRTSSAEIAAAQALRSQQPTLKRARVSHACGVSYDFAVDMDPAAAARTLIRIHSWNCPDLRCIEAEKFARTMKAAS